MSNILINNYELSLMYTVTILKSRWRPDIGLSREHFEWVMAIRNVHKSHTQKKKRGGGGEQHFK